MSRESTARMTALAAALLILLADRLTKLLILHYMQAYESISVIPGWLRIVHAENPGAAFGVLAEGNPILRSIVLIGVSGAVLIFVASALWNRSGAFRSAGTRFGLALILGGAFGNLFDRIFRGTVTDFIEVYHGTWSFPAFNVADSAITVGAALLVIDLIRPHPRRIEKEKAHT
ncbi:MAG: signal peptidase II [Acidobacteriaceae bacterium]|nr:signal peptidase II [Acidobacteriaceae bacterium]